MVSYRPFGTNHERVDAFRHCASIRAIAAVWLRADPVVTRHHKLVVMGILCQALGRSLARRRRCLFALSPECVGAPVSVKLLGSVVICL